jgi:putative transposase
MSGYYSWKRGAGHKRTAQDKQLTKEIEEDHKGRYGSPRIEQELRKKGIKTSVKRVARLMKSKGLRAKTKKIFKATTNSNHNLPVARNLLQQNFKISEIDNVWTSDITGIWT